MNHIKTARRLFPCLSLLLLLAVTTDAANILVQHTPGGSSHLMELLAVGKTLASRGHHLTFCLEDWEVEIAFKANKALFDNQNFTLLINKAYSTPQQGHRAFLTIRDKFATLGKNPIAALQYVLGVQADLCRRFVTNPVTSAKLQTLQVDLVIADFSHPCAVILADMKNAPYVMFSPTSLGEPLFTGMVGVDVPHSIYPMHGTGMWPNMTYSQRLGNFAAYHFMKRVLAPAMLHNDLRKELNVRMRSSLGDTRLFLLNADFAVEFPLSLPPLFKMVGPLLASPAKPLTKEFEDLLKSGSEGSLYASFGSAFVLDKKEEVHTFASALSTFGQRGYVVVWRITDDELPIGAKLSDLQLHPNVHPVTWAPQNDILGSPHLSVFITHGGTNGCYEAPYHGKPMVNIPFANDHMDHAAKVEWRGFGITVDRATLTQGNPTVLIEAVDRIITNPSYKANAEKVGRMLRGYARLPVERAADWVEYAMAMPADGSGDLKGMSGELSWFALHSLDVLAGWMAILTLAVCVVLGGVYIVYRVVKRVVGFGVHTVRKVKAA